MCPLDCPNNECPSNLLDTRVSNSSWLAFLSCSSEGEGASIVSCSPSYSPRKLHMAEKGTHMDMEMTSKVQDNHGVDEMKWYVDYVIGSELQSM